MKNIVEVVCFWGGNIVRSSDDINYSEDPKNFTSVSRNTSFDELKKIILTAMCKDPFSYKLKLSCKMPLFGRGGASKYFEFQINDGNAIERMFQIPTYVYNGVPLIYVYAETEVVGGSRSGCSPPHYTIQTYENQEPAMSSWINVGGEENAVGCSNVDVGTSHEFHTLDMTDVSTSDANVPSENDDVDSELAINDEADVDEDSEKRGHVPTAPWFTTQNIEYNTITDHPGNVSMYDIQNTELYEGAMFMSKETLVAAVRAVHIRSSRNYCVEYSSTKVYQAKCVVSGCPWRLRAALRKRHGCWEISVLPAEHNCVFATLARDHKKLGSRLIADTIKAEVINDPAFSVKNIIEKINSVFKYHVSYRKAWIGKQKAIADVYGEWTTSYAKLPQFLSAIKEFNPGSVVEIEANADPINANTSICRRVFWSFKPMIDGWLHARPVLSVDGTFLKGRYTGKLLIAMGFDSDNHQYPVAFAIVSEETTSNWSWFLRRVRRHVCKSRRGVCIISDRHAGLIAAMNDERTGFSNDWGVHRFCLLHVRANFIKEFPGNEMKNLCWAAGNTTQLRKFERFMKKINNINPAADKWLRDIPLEKWTMSHDGGYRYGQATTNIVECYNGNVRSARFLPITAMIEYIYYRSVVLVAERRTSTFAAIATGNIYCNTSVALFMRLESKASSHRVVPYNEQRGVFEVITGRYMVNGFWKGGNKQTVDLPNRWCSCGKWARYHCPCSHLIAGCLQCNLDWKQYIEPHHLLQTLEKMWEAEFHPLAHTDYWNFALVQGWENFGTLVPDENLKKKKQKRGTRGASVRIRTEMDRSSRAVVCSQCGGEGHTKRSKKCPIRNMA